MNRSVLVSFAILFSLFTVLLIPLCIHAVKASAASIEISPNTTVQNGADFVLNITVNNASDMHAWGIDIRFRKVIKITNVEAASWVVNDHSYNYYELAVNSTGAWAELHFTAVYNGTTQIDVLGSTILDSEGNEIPHTCSSCSVTVLGSSEQYFLNVCILGLGSYDMALGMKALSVAPDTPAFCGNGTMTYVYDSCTNVTIEVGGSYKLCEYIRVDNTTYTTKAICVTMDSDHEVLLSFRFPVLTVHTTEPDTEVQIGFNSGVTNSSGYVAIESPVGNWTLKAAKWGYCDVIQDIALTGDRSIDIQMNKTSYITPAVPYAVGVRSGTWMTYAASSAGSLKKASYYNVTVENVTGTVISGYSGFGADHFLLNISTGSTRGFLPLGLPLIIPANLTVGQFIPPLVPFNSSAYVQEEVYWNARKAIRATGYDHGSAYTFYWDQATGVLLEARAHTSTILVETNAFDVSFPAGGNTDFPLALFIGLVVVIVIASVVFLAKHRKTKQSTRTVQKLQACANHAMPRRHRTTMEVLHIADLKVTMVKWIEKTWKKKGTILWVLILLFPIIFIEFAFLQAAIQYGSILLFLGLCGYLIIASYVMIMMTPFGWVWLPVAIFVTIYKWGKKSEEKERETKNVENMGRQ